MDSFFQFLSTSLENLISILLKGGKQNFSHTIKILCDTPFTFAKGVFPYSYVDGPTKFEETELPPIKCFYNALTDEPRSTDEHQRAQNIWTHYGIQNLGQYHDHYLLSGVLLLADVFQHFRHDVLQNHGLDCLYFPTLPSLAWSMALKHTQVEIDLITDPNMYLMIESSIHGGIATISGPRQITLSSPITTRRNQQPISFLGCE